MDLYFKPFYKKDSYIIDTKISFDDNCDFEASVHKYYVNSGFDLYTVDDEYSVTEKIVATVNAIFFDVKGINDDGINIEDVADVINTSFTDDIVSAIELFLNDDLFPKADLDKTESLCYLNRVYIYPEFRDNGVATYIFENIQGILEYITGKEPQVLLIFQSHKNQQVLGGVIQRIKTI